MGVFLDLGLIFFPEVKIKHVWRVFFSAAFGEKISRTFPPMRGKVAVGVLAWTGAQWVNF